jgi:hypothetical protein
MDVPRSAPATEDGYRQLVAAVLRQAVADARGVTFAPGTRNPAQVQAEARAWLAAEDGPRDLVELCGCDSAPVLHRLRQVLTEVTPAPLPVPGQMSLFGENTTAGA